MEHPQDLPSLLVGQLARSLLRSLLLRSLFLLLSPSHDSGEVEELSPLNLPVAIRISILEHLSYATNILHSWLCQTINKFLDGDLPVMIDVHGIEHSVNVIDISLSEICHLPKSVLVLLLPM